MNNTIYYTPFSTINNSYSKTDFKPKSNLKFFMNLKQILRKEKSALFKEKYQSRIDEIDNLISSKKLPYNRIAILTAEKNKLETIL